MIFSKKNTPPPCQFKINPYLCPRNPRGRARREGSPVETSRLNLNIMATRTKRNKGLGYFPLDCDFMTSPEFTAIRKEYGLKGMFIAISTLSAIYSEGYYAQLDPLLRKLSIMLPEISPAQLRMYLHSFARRSLFSHTLLRDQGIVTSHGLQRRFFEAIAEKRNLNAKEISALPHILLEDDELPGKGDYTQKPQKTPAAQNSNFNVEKEKVIQKEKEKKSEGKTSFHTDYDYKAVEILINGFNLVRAAVDSDRKQKGLPPVRIARPLRPTAKRTALAESFTATFPREKWTAYFATACNSKFCNGLQWKGQRPATFDWLISLDDDGRTRIAEDETDNTTPAAFIAAYVARVRKGQANNNNN